MTINEIFDKCLLQHWSSPRFVASGRKYQATYLHRKYIKDSLGPLPAVDLTPPQIRQWHEELGGTPIAANRALELLSRLFSFAQERELIPWQHANPCSRVKSNQEPQRDRLATEEELKRIGQAILVRQHKSPRVVAFLIMLALTGARPKSLMKLVRTNISADGTMVVKFYGKSTASTGIQETIVIPPLALDLLRRLPARDDGLLIGKVSYKGLWNEIREEAGCRDVWARDLRHFFAQVAMSNGVGSDSVGEILNHKSAQTTKRYARMMLTRRVTTATFVSDKLATIMELRG